jgi:hypothetical protein
LLFFLHWNFKQSEEEMKKQLLLLIPAFLSLISACTTGPKSIKVSVDDSIPQLEFALKELEFALEGRGLAMELTDGGVADVVLALSPGQEGLKEEGFKIERASSLVVRSAFMDWRV